MNTMITSNAKAENKTEEPKALVINVEVSTDDVASRLCKGIMLADYCKGIMLAD